MFKLQKIYSRLCILDNSDNLIYTYPDFVQVISRKNFQDLIDELNEDGYYNIDRIIKFESDIRFRRDLRMKRKF